MAVSLVCFSENEDLKVCIYHSQSLIWDAAYVIELFCVGATVKVYYDVWISIKKNVSKKSYTAIQNLMEAISFESAMNDYWFFSIIPKTTENNPKYFCQNSQSDRHL